MKTLDRATQPSRTDVTVALREAYDLIAAEYAERNLGPASPDHRSWLARLWHCLPPRSVIVDVGCGPGRDGACLSALGARVIGLDLSARMLQIAATGQLERVAQADAFQLPLRQRSVDGVLMASLVLHVRRPDLVDVLTEAHRVLRPGGVVALNTPLGGSEGWDLQPYDPIKHSYAVAARRWFVYRSEAEVRAAADETGFGLLWVERRQRYSQWLDVLLRCS